MPALTINTDNPPSNNPPSPSRPPVSPLTPPLRPTELPAPGTSGSSAAARPSFTLSQPDQTAIPPPAPQPLDFDANPDVIALKSAISILQIQRQRATADIQALSRAKDEAVQNPEAFISDLVANDINAPANDDSDSDDDDADMSGQGSGSQQRDPGEGSSKQRIATEPPAWRNIPQPQNVVRCPPINWSQYAVVGDSLDKLHNEQVVRPNQGTPATVGANGMYEFRGEGKQEKYQGVAAPYAPTQDRLKKKPKSRKS
ncbi:unnamed protein product [Fusarium graminearum]|uniref:Chromosome 1, complete genome n=2 Tax=Gibberella zeae TaxID=5518 RepID=I1RCA3_GIBZE|nr:hypothetical protein FGSG_01206 [Fusarium graminearum PH-1]EYB24500.1 hypothetical protein FG05_01206 [Fusarium graminearum]ESU06495.1 hypothetical protein FGSG_01206 [Fusarium graminearum PH-1]KAI6760264.1 hypothetical protein HG531_013465 [Fusarium graminearum]PCD22672.1 hypothetical protein FGRA07_04042 [Fusarium graminearum]CAF3448983.1 unnamed protein product [Fusarium graminearum]|eukprot:XP_011316980.1 hypothetical protein FGSG_01206 [Fusarium graminearum PH-1]